MSLSPPSFTIRNVQLECDIFEIHAIYSYYVANSIATWEFDVPSLAVFGATIRDRVGAGYPFVVAVSTPAAIPEGGAAAAAPALAPETIVGYSCASLFRGRPGWRFCVETSIYVKRGHERCGIGRALVDEVLKQSAARGFRQAVATISVDTRLGESNASIGMHEALGFKRVALFPSVGFKFDAWLDAAFLQRSLGDGATTPPVDGALPPALQYGAARGEAPPADPR